MFIVVTSSIRHSLKVQKLAVLNTHFCVISTIIFLFPDDSSLTQSFRPHCGPGVDSTANRNEFQEFFLRGGGKGGQFVGLTTLPPSCADYLEIREPEPPGTLWTCNRHVQGLLYLFTFFYRRETVLIILFSVEFLFLSVL